MKIESRFLAPHIEAAAIDQLSADLADQGYRVERESRAEFAGRQVRFDLEARRGTERVFYEFKVVGTAPSPPGQALAALTGVARGLGAQFRLIVVHPERGVEVSVPGLEDALRAVLEDDPTGELGRLGSSVDVTEVSSLEISSIALAGGGASDISGAAVVYVNQYANDEGNVLFGRSEFPFQFKVRLLADGDIASDPEPDFDLDLSSWYGDDASEDKSIAKANDSDSSSDDEF